MRNNGNNLVAWIYIYKLITSNLSLPISTIFSDKNFHCKLPHDVFRMEVKLNFQIWNLLLLLIIFISRNKYNTVVEWLFCWQKSSQWILNPVSVCHPLLIIVENRKFIALIKIPINTTAIGYCPEYSGAILYGLLTPLHFWPYYSSLDVTSRKMALWFNPKIAINLTPKQAFDSDTGILHALS